MIDFERYSEYFSNKFENTWLTLQESVWKIFSNLKRYIPVEDFLYVFIITKSRLSYFRKLFKETILRYEKHNLNSSQTVFKKIIQR